ncbi:MAG: MerC domain-containing protein [Woeseiaceae bacterium]|nr:MerC domain-containing protein [Woeseiaceae bacterium]
MSTSTTVLPTDLGRGVSRLNLLAAGLSAVCLIHCLALPVLISLLALSVPFTENEFVHVGLVLMAAPATLWVMHKSRSHRNHRLFIAVAAIGLTLLLAGTFFSPLASFEEHLTIVGALLLVTAHIRHWSNLRVASRTVGHIDSQSRSTG